MSRRRELEDLERVKFLPGFLHGEQRVFLKSRHHSCSALLAVIRGRCSWYALLVALRRRCFESVATVYLAFRVSECLMTGLYVQQRISTVLLCEDMLPLV